MKFVNPKNDVAFRKIFGNQQKSAILIGFLNAVLGLTGQQAIQSVQILNPYQTPKLETLKMTILDVRATDKRGITFIVEMQIEHTVAVKKRFTYYTAKAYAGQIERGEDYPKLNQVIFIGILDFILFEKNNNYLTRHHILDITTHNRELEDLEFNFIELPKFDKCADDVETMLDKWIYFIKNADDLEIEPEHVTDLALKEAYKSANQFGWSKADLEAYEYRGIRIQDARGALTFAERRGLQQGLEQGLEQGLQQGLEQGLQQGLEQGLQQGLEQGLQDGFQQGLRDAARNMLAKGFDPAEVAELTGLSLTEVTDLATST